MWQAEAILKQVDVVVQSAVGLWQAGGILSLLVSIAHLNQSPDTATARRLKIAAAQDLQVRVRVAVLVALTQKLRIQLARRDEKRWVERLRTRRGYAMNVDVASPAAVTAQSALMDA